MEKKENEETKCFFKVKFLANCIPSRSSKPHCDNKSRVDGDTTRSGHDNNGEIRSSRLRKFTMKELKLATRNFSANNKLGGSVYKGRIKENGQTIKVVIKTDYKTWMAEVGMHHGQFNHSNLVRLIGDCNNGDQHFHKRFLVYEFMFHGSLKNHLYGEGSKGTPLSWVIRMKIVVGAAQALAFLHEEAKPPVIYGDFKTSDILLDEDYNAKLLDFGIAKNAMGTFDYRAPESIHLGFTSTSCVYSFGVVLLEIVTGQRSTHTNKPHRAVHNKLVEWAKPLLGDEKKINQLIDPRLKSNFSIEGARIATELAARCLRKDPRTRPLMSEVVQILKPLPNFEDMAASTSSSQTAKKSH